MAAPVPRHRRGHSAYICTSEINTSMPMSSVSSRGAVSRSRESGLVLRYIRVDELNSATRMPHVRASAVQQTATAWAFCPDGGQRYADFFRLPSLTCAMAVVSLRHASMCLHI